MVSCYISLGLLACLRFEGGWGGCQGGLTTEPEDMVGALGYIGDWFSHSIQPQMVHESKKLGGFFCGYHMLPPYGPLHGSEPSLTTPPRWHSPSPRRLPGAPHGGFLGDGGVHEASLNPSGGPHCCGLSHGGALCIFDFKILQRCFLKNQFFWM